MARARSAGGTRRFLIWGLGIGVGSLLTLAVAAYSFFWLPYRHPEEAPMPRIVSLVPRHPVRDRSVEHLSELTWVDRSAGIARVPIELAMDLVRERLPVRREDAPQPKHGPANSDAAARQLPTDAGSGRWVAPPSRQREEPTN